MEPVDAVMQRLRQELQQQGFPDQPSSSPSKTDQPLSPPVKSEPLWWKGEPLWWKAYMKGVNAEKEHRNHEAEDHFVEALKLVVKVVDPDEDLCLIWNDLGALFRKQSRYAIRRSLTKLQPKLEQQRIKLG
jgi:hypothetical protein